MDGVLIKYSSVTAMFLMSWFSTILSQPFPSNGLIVRLFRLSLRKRRDFLPNYRVKSQIMSLPFGQSNGQNWALLDWADPFYIPAYGVEAHESNTIHTNSWPFYCYRKLCSNHTFLVEGEAAPSVLSRAILLIRICSNHTKQVIRAVSKALHHVGS